MPEFVDNTVKDIDEQLRQLRDEVSRLEAARSALTGGRRGPGRPRGMQLPPHGGAALVGVRPAPPAPPAAPPRPRAPDRPAAVGIRALVRPWSWFASGLSRHDSGHRQGDEDPSPITCTACCRDSRQRGRSSATGRVGIPRARQSGGSRRASSLRRFRPELAAARWSLDAPARAAGSCE